MALCSKRRTQMVQQKARRGDGSHSRVLTPYPKRSPSSHPYASPEECASQHMAQHAGASPYARASHARARVRWLLSCGSSCSYMHTARRGMCARAHLGLGVGAREGLVDAHDLARGAHLRTQHGVAARELAPRHHHLLDAHVRQRGLLGEADLRQQLARHQQRCVLDNGVADGLGHKGHGPAGRRAGGGGGLDARAQQEAAGRERRGGRGGGGGKEASSAACATPWNNL